MTDIIAEGRAWWARRFGSAFGTVGRAGPAKEYAARVDNCSEGPSMILPSRAEPSRAEPSRADAVSAPVWRPRFRGPTSKSEPSHAARCCPAARQHADPSDSSSYFSAPGVFYAPSAVLASALILAGCGGTHSASMMPLNVASMEATIEAAVYPAALGHGPAAEEAVLQRDMNEFGNHPSAAGQASEPDYLTDQTLMDRAEDVAAPAPAARERAVAPSPPGAGSARSTRLSHASLAALPRYNPEAEDLLRHWGHRQVSGIVNGLTLGAPELGMDTDDLRALRAAPKTSDDASPAAELRDEDAVRVLGSRRGITYGRWTGGPADTLPIEFDYSEASPGLRNDKRTHGAIERAGKLWSHRITDTWVEPLKVKVKDDDNRPGVLASATYTSYSIVEPDRSFQPRTGVLNLRPYFNSKGGLYGDFSPLFVHELGHVLGAWSGTIGEFSHYVDWESGTWTGPNVASLHGAPASFFDGAPPPAARGDASWTPEFDFSHSGVCGSAMSYVQSSDCKRQGYKYVPGPEAMDLAFLADLGMTVREETDRPETYNLAGWTDYAGFSVSVSRDLRVDLMTPHYVKEHDVTDLLDVGVDVFGYRSTGTLPSSYPHEGLDGTVHYAGGLLGAAISRAGLPPVTGNAALAVNLGTLDGTAQFTSLEVHIGESSDIFAGGSLYYPFDLSANTITGTDSNSTLRADFYGSGHENVAGVFHDPRAGLLASFGATFDDRPSREDLITSANYMRGTVQHGSTIIPSIDSGESQNVYSEWIAFRCGADSTCESRYDVGTYYRGWYDRGRAAWRPTTREDVLARTAGWNGRSTAKLVDDNGPVKIEKQIYATNSANGWGEGHTGTLEYVTFGLFHDDIEQWTDSNLFPYFGTSTGVQGFASARPPASLARWSGPMFGVYNEELAEGLTTVEYSLSENEVDVAFTKVRMMYAKESGVRAALPGFGFEGLRVDPNGEFHVDDRTGYLSGAFFGPTHEEVAGEFVYLDGEWPSFIGSFGARQVSGALPPIDTIDELSFDTALRHATETAGAAQTAAKAVEVARASTSEATRAANYASTRAAADAIEAAEAANTASSVLQDAINAAIRFDAVFDHDRGVWVGTFGEAIEAYQTVVSEIFSAALEARVVAFSVDQTAHTYDPEPTTPDPTTAEAIQAALDTAHDAAVGVAEVTLAAAEAAAAVIDASSAAIRVAAAATAEATYGAFVAAEAAEAAARALEAALDAAPDSEAFYAAANAVEAALEAAREARRVANASQDPPMQIAGVLSNAVVGSGSLRVVVGDHSVAPEQDKLVPTDDYRGIAVRTGHIRDGELGSTPESLSPESLGPWSNTAFHLRGDIIGGIAFGAARRNGLVRPWGYGPKPDMTLANNPALSGTATWNGALLGFTSAGRTVAGDAQISVDVATLDGRADFTGLESWAVSSAPGTPGSGSQWRDGDLGYDIAVQDNAFRKTGGDVGTLTGVFVGHSHEGVVGTLESEDLSAAFGGMR